MDYLTWSMRYADKIDFVEMLRSKGKLSSVPERPEISIESVKLWEYYALLSENIINDLHILTIQNGLPDEWEFIEVALLFNDLRAHYHKLRDKDHGRNNIRNKN